VGRNGKHQPPRPKIEIEAPGASEDEAAAIAAALERFLAETAPESATPKPNPWRRAALYEGAGGDEGTVDPWGDEWSWGSR
jgi:hypothetical protein